MRALESVNISNFGSNFKPGVKVTLDLLKKEKIVAIAAFTLL